MTFPLRQNLNIFIILISEILAIAQALNNFEEKPRIQFVAPFNDTLDISYHGLEEIKEFLVFNKTLVRLELECNFHMPVTWDLQFDPYVNHWTDAFWIQSHREFHAKLNQSLKYSSVLKIRYHDPIPVPLIFRCLTFPNSNSERNSSKALSGLTVENNAFLKKFPDNNYSVIAYTELKSSNETISELSEIKNNFQTKTDEETCKVTYLVKEIAVGKFQWKCVIDKTVSPKISYRHNWYCTNAAQCRNYYARAKNRKTCVKKLTKNDECSGCITYSGFTSLVLFCKTDENTEHRVLPIVYTLRSQEYLPKQVVGWNNLIPLSSNSEDLLQFQPIPENLSIGDEILLECHASEFIFSTSIVFVLRYADSTPEYIKLDTKFSFKYGAQSQTYTSFFEDESNSSTYDIPTNARIYRYKLTMEMRHWYEHGGLDEILCKAPLTESTGWITKSQKVGKLPVEKLPHSTDSGYKFKIQNPKITILPLSPPAEFSQSNVLVIKIGPSNNFQWSFKLNCTFTGPIQWKVIEQRDFSLVLNPQLYRKISRGSKSLEDSIFLSSLIIDAEFRKTTLFSIGCFSLLNPLQNSVVTLGFEKDQGRPINSIGNQIETLLGFRVSHVPYNKYGIDKRQDPLSTRLEDTCLTVYIIKEIDSARGNFEWKCVDGQQTSEQMNDVTEIQCQDYFSCKMITDRGIVQDPTKCLRILKNDEPCENCERRLRTLKINYAAYLGCSNPLKGVTYQPVYILRNSSASVLHYKLPDGQSLLQLEEVKDGVLYLNQNYTITCSASQFLFSRGLRIELEHADDSNSTTIVTGHEETIHTSSGLIIIYYNVSIPSADLIKITCFAPMSSSSDWTNASQAVKVVESSAPMISQNSKDGVKINGNIGETNKTLVCQSFGVPTPKISWKLPEEVSENALALREVLRRTEANESILIFKSVLKLHTGVYECISSNAVGSTSKLYYFETKEKNMTGYQNIVIISLTCLAVVLVAVSLFIFWRCWRLKKAVQILTQAEIDAFFKGEILIEDKVNPDMPNRDVYCQPFNKDYELSGEVIKFDRTNILGEGAFGIVCVGYLAKDTATKIAVKLAKPSANLEVFKALLAEVKVMAFLGEHENLIKFIGASTANIRNKEIVIVLEYCCSGNLKNFLCQKRAEFQKEIFSDSEEREKSTYENMAKHYPNTYKGNVMDNEYINTSSNECSVHQLVKWSLELANGCQYLESKRVVHGDIAARNVLLDENLTAKLSDFGLSRVISEYSNYAKSPAECPLPWKWLSPECLTDMKFSTKSDVWAFGITLWEIFSLGENPYPGMSYTIDFVDMLKSGLRPKKPAAASNEIFSCMEKCWAELSKERPQFGFIKNNLLSELLSTD